MNQVPPPLPSSTGDEAAPQSIPNHLVWAIIAAVLAACLCCPIGLLGIVAIVYSSKVNSLLNQGDLDGAKRASNNARLWCWVATGLAILGLLYNIIWIAAGGLDSIEQILQQLR